MKIKSLLLGFLLLFGAPTFLDAQEAVTEFTELAERPAVGDLFIVVDVSDTTDSAGGTTKKITLANLMKGVPYDFNWGFYLPSSSMQNVYAAKINRAVNITSIVCIVDPADSGETVVVNIYECDSNGDNCATVITQVTCANTPTTASITDSSWATGSLIKLTIGTVTGTVTSLLIYGTGTQN